jgi:ATP phosphoribosyltransferase regulatory subunit
MKQALEKKRLKEDLSKKILSIFKKNKFNFTDLDLLIDTSLLTERSGEQFKKFTLTYKDLFGKEISLRPDLTVSTALKYIQEKRNKEEKYCYYGSAYRLDKEGDLKVFDQIGCEIINSNNKKSENILINSILEPLKKIKNLEIVLGDVGLFKILVESLELPARWKLRLVKNFSRREYFEDMLKRLETNYDLDQQAIKLDTKRLKDLEKLDPNSIIGGRTISEIIKRFNKKLKDPRDDYKGKRNVKIIRDFLNINSSIQKAESIILSFFLKNKLSNLSIKSYLKKINRINKETGKKYFIKFKTNFGRNTDYYTGVVFLASVKKNSKIIELARGGEYNGLLRTLGYKRDVPAIGGAINLNELINL